MTAMTTSYDATSFRARRNGSEASARSFAAESAKDHATVEHGTPILNRDVIAAWVAAPFFFLALLAA
ncbi:MAG TPA: hypothetical protein VEC75_12515 [Stellaceae bacterium]|nr:hypothetical protein [Stellaceae bacterium]